MSRYRRATQQPGRHRKNTKTFENQTLKPKNHGNNKKNQKNHPQAHQQRDFEKKHAPLRQDKANHKEKEMRTSLKTLLLCVALVAMAACSAQKRAERHIRKAVAECPELVQVKAHPIDTVLTAPGFADMVALPLSTVLSFDTLYAATDHGTVVVSLRQSDSALRVGFVAAPREVRYRDTLRYAQVVLHKAEPAPPAKRGGGVAWALLGVVVAFGAGMALCFRLHRKR